MDTDHTPIAWPLRAWIAVEIFFGVAAMATIGLNPQDTAVNFAWPIKPEATAALLGAFYTSSAWVFVLAVFARRWAMIRVMVIPVILFTFIELLATFLHWERFSLWTTQFNLWFASYLLPPGIFAACYVWHQRRATATVATSTVATSTVATTTRLDRRVHGLLLLLGCALTLLGVLAFVWPPVLIAIAPWNFTPLTTRALCGWIVILGAMMLSIAKEDDRDRSRIVSPFFVLLLPLVAWQLSRFPTQVKLAHPTTLIGAAVLAMVFALGVYLARGSWRQTLR